jgi:Ca2+-binding RTX toxin-like protein
MKSARLAAGTLAAGLLALTAAQADAAPSIKVKHDALTIKGSGKSDKLALRLHSGALDTLDVDVGDDGSADFSVARDRVARIRIKTKGGDDQVRIDDANGAFTDTIQTTIDGGAGKDDLIGADTVDGNGGDDRVDLGAGKDSFVWDAGDGSDTVDGGDGGRDTITFNGSDADERFELSAHGARARLERDLDGVRMNLDGVEQVDLATAGGADGLTVDDLAGTDVRTVDSDLHADAAADTVVVNATNGDDVITAAGSAGSVNVSGLAAAVDVTGAEAAHDTLSINALGGDDVVEASGLAADAIRLTADGGDNDDVLIGGAGDDTLLGGANDDVLIGGPGQDVLDGGPGDNIVIQD